MLYSHFLLDLLIAEAVSAFIDRGTDNAVEAFFHLSQFNTVLRTFWSGKARYNGSKIQLDQVGEFRVFCCTCTEHALCFVISFNESDLLF
ncbi:hypothetical protein D3C78_1264470 [compost metagenome]